MWVAAVICFIAFGIEFSRGTLGCFDDVRRMGRGDKKGEERRRVGGGRGEVGDYRAGMLNNIRIVRKGLLTDG